MGRANGGGVINERCDNQVGTKENRVGSNKEWVTAMFSQKQPITAFFKRPP